MTVLRMKMVYRFVFFGMAIWHIGSAFFGLIELANLIKIDPLLLYVFG